MFRGILIMEDNQVAITVHDATDATITVCDGKTGFERTVSCSCTELAATLALAVGSDEMEGAEVLYRLAEPLQERLLLTELEQEQYNESANLLRLIP